MNNKVTNILLGLILCVLIYLVLAINYFLPNSFHKSQQEALNEYLKNVKNIFTNFTTSINDNNFNVNEKKDYPNGNITFRNENGEILITQQDIQSIGLQKIKDDIYTIQIKFTKEGTKKFSIITKTHLNKNISIYKGDRLISEPLVQAPINDGIVIIEGMKDLKEALDFFKLLVN